MKVVLLEDVKGQGKKGDVITVAEGYARNYLIPKKLAVEATEAKLKEISQQKAAQAMKRKKEEEEARATAARMEGIKVHIKTKVGEGGKFFGAVSNKDIAEGLAQQHGFKLDKKKIMLKEPIKTLGEHPVTVKLHPSVQATIIVLVESD